VSPLRRAAGILALACSLAGAANGEELYGRPLRGLTAVAPGEVAKNPAKYSGRSVRVEGTLRRGKDGGLWVAQGEGVLGLRTDGFTLPAAVDGAPAAAEGRVSPEGDGAILVASGVEVRR